MATINVKDAAGATVAIAKIADTGSTVDASSLPVTQSTEDKAVLASVKTAVELIDDAIKTEDVAASAGDKGVAILAVRRDADTTLVGTDNDYANLQVDANGYLKVEVFDGGGSHTVDNAGTFAVQIDAGAVTSLALIDDVVFAEDTAATAADKGMAILAVRRDADTTLVGTDNDYANLQVDANGYLKVEIFDGGGSHTVDNAGTFAVQETPSTTGTQTSVASSATDITILASNASRKGALIFNDDANVLYLLLTSGTSSTTNYSVQVPNLGYFEVPALYNGVIKGIWAADGSGSARVTELT